MAMAHIYNICTAVLLGYNSYSPTRPFVVHSIARSLHITINFCYKVCMLSQKHCRRWPWLGSKAAYFPFHFIHMEIQPVFCTCYYVTITDDAINMSENNKSCP